QLEQRSGLCGRAFDLRLGQAQPDGESDETLLRTVVEVPLDPAALRVAGLDDAQARRGELVASVCARHRQPDELGGRLQAALGLRWKRLVGPERRDQRAPAEADEIDRNAGARLEPEAAHLRR